MPCVIYLHGNTGSRLDSLTLLEPVMEKGCSLCALDFSGCGISEG